MSSHFHYIVLAALLAASGAAAQEATTVTARVVDADSGEVLPARVYVQDEEGAWHYAEAAEGAGQQAVTYKREHWDDPEAQEHYTNVPAAPFTLQLAPGAYTVTVERGHEYTPLTREVTVGQEPQELTLELQRWSNMAKQGWYSGDTHVHRTVEELKTILPAEDLNVAFPLTYWVADAYTPPAQGNKSVDTPPAPELIKVDDTHVIWPLNTEYEIVDIEGQRHMLGALFIINHDRVLEKGAPPLLPITGPATERGALLELDKHDWPWSIALVAALGVDLYELSNNHVWRTRFGITKWSTPAPDFMGLPNNAGGNEVDWLRFTHQTYYALLNSGFHLRPTAGTANGVHPVPLGFGRVYVYTGEDFGYDKWIAGLDAGKSFVTTGPMLIAMANDDAPGTKFDQDEETQRYVISGAATWHSPLDRIEIVQEGEVIETIPAANTQHEHAYESTFAAEVEVDRSTWFAVRCYGPVKDDKVRFAHTAPWHVTVPDKPMQPKREEVAYLIQRVEDEIARSRDVLSEEAIAEYEKALKVYQALLENAQP